MKLFHFSDIVLCFQEWKAKDQKIDLEHTRDIFLRCLFELKEAKNIGPVHIVVELQEHTADF
jgi:hypothetical protein